MWDLKSEESEDFVVKVKGFSFQMWDLKTLLIIWLREALNVLAFKCGI